MSWRVVVISKRAKLDYQLGYLVVRNESVRKSQNCLILICRRSNGTTRQIGKGMLQKFILMLFLVWILRERQIVRLTLH